MPDIFDNLTTESSIGPALKTALANFDSCDIATGYFDLRGWASFSDIVNNKVADRQSTEPAVARVLIGMVMPADSALMLAALQDAVQPPPYGSDLNDMGKALAAKDQLVKHLRTQLMRGLPSEGEQTTLQQLKGQLESGAVEVKVFTTAPLHGKTYIFHAPGNAFAERRAYVGSSNLTNAGLFKNLELNIDVVEKDAAGKLAAWFTDRWDDPFSLRISSEIIDLIAESWASETQPTPYEVYLKVCHAMSEDAREGLGYVLPPSIENLLLDYQETAVRTLARRIVRRGGTMLGDVVGLGKTLTAIATALMLEAAEDYTTLVLCPKNLERMWNEHLERYDLRGSRVIPYSVADRRLPELKRFHLVICDESHNLRNSSTRAYEAIQDYIRRNGSKVLLLTATPYNLAFADVANQVGLYIDDDEDLGIQPTAAMTKDKALVDKVDGKITTLAAFRRSEEAEDWKRLMSDHLVRRTRSFIKRTAKKEMVSLPGGGVEVREYLEFANGQRFHFPIRVPKPLSLDFADDDPAQFMESDDTLDAIRDLVLPRYRLAEYDNPKAPHTIEDAKIIADIRSGRGNVSGFVRIGLFKRLSSSGHSFILSLQRQRARNELFVYAIDNALAVPLGSFSDHQFTVSDSDLEEHEEMGGSLASRYRELHRRLPASTKWLQTGIFKSSLRKDLLRDNAIITQLLDRFGAWDPVKDTKANALVDMLRDDHPGEKVLVFTEYADTAEYVAKALKDAGVQHVGLAYGDSDDPAAIARRFSPESNRLPGEETEEMPVMDPIDVLVATDVLSEGQNLQDSHIVVNYDLPWAIIRIIQRAGRVDRVGQKSDRVFIYMITHEKVEQAILLRQRIRQRLGDNAAAFGSDERFFGDEKEVNLLDDLYKGAIPSEDELVQDEGEADAVSEAWLVWSNIKDQNPHLAAKVMKMQDLMHSSRGPYGNEVKTGVTTYARTSTGIDAFAASFDSADGSSSVERLLTPLEALHVFRADETTPTAPLRRDHFDREALLVKGKLGNEMVAAGALRGVRKWAVERLGGTIYGADASDAVSAMMDRPLTEYANVRLRQARRSKYSDQDLADLVKQVHGEERLVIGSAEKEEIKIVCSIGVTAR
ncbi:helicase-related protein [Trujillonella endophytica]|uniref:PLD-like domain-containing protein n=1 Tax=Trujillonella endophytica TaxID=673521 RepID=A0A1H8SA20_9ACTN|nr:helicase-related protein [Trujillella endophytica]SEO75445.1 PLD-like domain-containing protein [Trujillella endophytica]